MTTKVIMPQMGESIFEGTITKWLKKVGDSIQRDEPLFEISTDKVDSEIPSPASGTLREILVPEGQTVQINTVVAVIDGDGAAAETAPQRQEPEKRAEGPRPAQQPPPKAERPAEEAPSEPQAKQEPSEKQAKPQPGGDEARKQAPAPKPAAPPAEAIVRAQEGPKREGARPASEDKRPAGPQPPPARQAPSREAQEVRASPLVRRLARENQVDISAIQGTGLGGRVTKHDILSFVDSRSTAPAAETLQRETPAAHGAPPAAPSPAPPPAQAPPPAPPPVTFAGETETVPMTSMRRAIAEHMVASRRTSAHVSTVFEIDMSAIARARDAQRAAFEAREGIKLTYTPFVAAALVAAVREFPVLNASVSGESIVYKRAVNLGVAVALDTGLIVPVVKDAHLKSFTGLALAIADLAERARTKKLRPEEVQGGTITLTNPGVYGGLFATPIINQPQVAILGVGGIQKRVVVIDDAIAIRPMVFLSLSFDHRVIDGAVADQFMARLKAMLQSWSE